MTSGYPWFRARKSSNGWLYDGQDRASFGHKITRQNAPTDGIYFQWNRDGDRLVIENDRYGFAPLFYYSSNNEFVVSPSIYKLIECGSDTTIDEDSLAVFNRLGFYLNNDTPFKHIRAIPPNSRGHWQQGRFQLDSVLPSQSEQDISES